MNVCRYVYMWACVSVCVHMHGALCIMCMHRGDSPVHIYTCMSEQVSAPECRCINMHLLTPYFIAIPLHDYAYLIYNEKKENPLHNKECIGTTKSAYAQWRVHMHNKEYICTMKSAYAQRRMHILNDKCICTMKSACAQWRVHMLNEECICTTENAILK